MTARRLAAALWLALAPSIAAQSAPATGLRHYDVTGSPVWRAELPVALAEVSGLAFTSDGRLYLHGDEQAAVFRFDPAARRTTERFGLAGNGGLLHGDFEDIQILGDRVFLVTSNAVIYEGRLAGDGQLVDAIRRTRGLNGTCETEGMTYDPATTDLLLLCKHAKSKRWKDRVVILAVSTRTWDYDTAPRMLVAEDRLAAVTGARHFSGSAITRDPRSGTYIMVAGPERVIAEIDAAGRVLGGAKLDGKRHRQPEGLAIGPERELLISYEAGRDAATITAYAYRP